MNWVQRKIYLYNVTFGLYMLDWWERYLFTCFFAFPQLLFRWFGGSLDVVRYVQRYTLLLRALQEAFDIKTSLVSRTVEHKEPGNSKGAFGFNI